MKWKLILLQSPLTLPLLPFILTGKVFQILTEFSEKAVKEK